MFGVGKSKQLSTKNEVEILKILWQSELPLTSSGIIEQSVGKSWQDRSIHSILNNLLDKKEIKVVGKIPAGKNYARQFAPAITEEEYLAKQISESDLYEETWSKISFKNVVSNLIDSSENKETLIDELKDLISELDEK